MGGVEAGGGGAGGWPAAPIDNKFSGEGALFGGLKVLDVGTWIAGPVAATMLADYGADVIKVEIPGAGDGYRQFAGMPGTPKAEVNYAWQMDAHSKRSITLNLKTDAGGFVAA